ncbi:uncharacterized protein K452DRAFT_249013 [Aplosporella prunicola CBS 121167]|uniref:LsmAD domain-containing protein n=1 Tax=Aplosporella prunicola CBS 121167 TaxID=1176127 RepID=A0A6A6BDW2_9PEZI|nr:uncharacterized protein K452DRAFT_249013 [Aplosporella prunicola CBS 121167]KAF2142360.1 hypothetical protein K452DRAFT_249013 [Aplosporella prunicola CBS 121167]
MASPNVTNGNQSAPGPGGNKAQLKTTASAKAMDGSRKQAGSPIDASSRRPPPPKAWSSGSTNPITQRPSNAPLPNGSSGMQKSPAGPKAMASNQASSDNNKHAHDRMVFLISNFVGLMATVTLKSGERFHGVFSTASLDHELRYAFKMVKRLPSSGAQVNGAAESQDEYCGSGPEHCMAFDVKDVVSLNVDGVSMDKTQAKSRNGTPAGFRTDTDISGNILSRERDLQRWVPSQDTDVDLSLDDSGAGWDQFEANERLFGATSNYNEDLYTTKIDRNNPQYRQKAAEAEKIAREIESGVADNAHIAEERGQIRPDDSGLDEEEKYSGVRREASPLSSGQPHKYTPPARRAPTGQATVSGAPFDPAIISSQLARPGPPATAAPQPSASGAKPQPQVPMASKSDEAKPPAATPAAGSSSTSATAAKPSDITAAASTGPSQKAPASQQPTTSDIQSIRKPGKPTVESELLDSFKQFSATEKLKVQERARHVARHDKNVKLNDLKKFAANFKYSAPIPDDLIPILAKDPSKQQEIKANSQRATEERKVTVSTVAEKSVAGSADAKQQQRASLQPGHMLQTNQANQRPRPGQGPFPQAPRGDRNGQNHNSMPPRNAPGMLGQRLVMNQQQHKAGAAMANMPHQVPAPDVRIPPSGPTASSSTGTHTPTSSISTRFNVKAMEFRPNPAANTFTPGGSTSNTSSPKKEPTPARTAPRRGPTSSFFGSQKPATTSARPSLSELFNPIKRMKKEVEAEHKTKEYAANGGIPQAYRTPPTWAADVPDANKDKSYTDMFERTPISGPPIAAPQTALANGPMPHQHQLPPHLQQGHGMPQVHTPQHTPRHPAVQPHHGPGAPHHFDGHHMQFSASNSSVHPSPRAGMPPYVYGPQMPQQVPQFQQAMPVFGMSPHGQPVALRQPGFVAQAPAMGGHMMVSQHSSGPGMFAGNPQMQPMPQMPQMQMYSPAPGHVYPHGGPMPPPLGATGFPSPRPPMAQMMTHQGSQQGHAPQQFVPMPNGGYAPVFQQMPQGSMTPMRGPFPQPHQAPYGSSPHQQHHFPQQHRGTPGTTYSQPMMAQHSMPPQIPPPAGPGPHGPDSGEKVE